MIVTDTPETDAAIRPYNNTLAGERAVAAKHAQRLERERNAALRRVKELEATIDMLTRHIDDDNADDAGLRSRLEAVESLAAKWEAQMVPASIYAAQLRELLAPAKSCDNCGETGCDREYDAGHNPCAKWRPSAPPAPEPPKYKVKRCEKCWGDDFPCDECSGKTAPEPPKCEECDWYRNATGIAEFCVVRERGEALDDVRGTDGACGPEGRLFKAKEPPKCEECAHYFTIVYPPFCTETRDSLRYARSTDGACGPTGRLFVRKVEVKT